MQATITLLPGDGIGPEIVREATRALDAVAKIGDHNFTYREALIGGAAIDQTGNPLPEETLASCRDSQAILLGAVGGPKWDDPNAKVRPEQGLLGLRKSLGLFANLRPVRISPSLAAASPLKPSYVEGIDLLVVRELTGGIYFGQPRLREVRDGVERAVDTLEYTEPEIRRVVELACTLAKSRKRHVTSVDKANVLESSRLWRSVATQVAQDHPEVKLQHQLVDSCAMRLITHAREFDVVVTGNMFGDILTDEAAVLGGSLGVLPSASLGSGSAGVYEPIHGSAPDIAGQGIANPVGTIMSAAMMLRHSLGLADEATQLEAACEAALAAGARTKDLGGSLGSAAMTDAIIAQLNA